MSEKHIITKLYDTMDRCITVNDLRDALNELIDMGLGDACVGYRVGITEDGFALSFPVASFRASKEANVVLLSAVPYKEDIDDDSKDFDTVITVNDDSLTVKIVNYTSKAEDESVFVDYSQQTGEE